MPDVAFLPETPHDAQLAVLAFAGVAGGGLLAYEVARAIRDGDILKTTDYPPNPEVGLVALVIGLGLFGKMVQESVAQVGWKPLLLGSAAIAGVAAVARVARR